MTTHERDQQTVVEAFHFLGDDRRLRYEPRTLIETGLRLEVAPPLEMCRHGLHGSVRALDALRYAPGALVCRTRHSGVVLQPANEDKLCSSVRDVIAGPVDATRVLHQFAVWVATQALNAERLAGREPDPRCWGALEVKLLWLDGKATDSELDAARDAAWAAARAAAGATARDAAWAAARAAAGATARDAAWAAARDAAWDAARAAAWDPARDAARDPAWAAARDAAWDAARAAAWDPARDAAWDPARDPAWAAARDAAWDKFNTELETRLLALLYPVVAAS